MHHNSLRSAVRYRPSACWARHTTELHHKETLEEKEAGHVKPFSSIPGPKSLPLVGTLWKYLPLIGEYTFDRLHWNGLKKLRTYGSLVREDIVPGVPIVWVFTPEDIETVYRSEGRYPERRSHLALQKYRLDRPNIYNSGGLLPTNGPEWWRLRSAFQHNLSRIQDVRSFLPGIDEVISVFVSARLHSTETKDFLDELSRLFLELLYITVFDEKLQCFSEKELTADSPSSALITAAYTANTCVLATDNGLQLWRKFHTPLYQKLEKSLQVLEKEVLDILEKKKKKLSSSKIPGPSIIEQYLSLKEVDIKDITGMTVDMLLAGIDTTTYTSGYALYHLAVNPHTQEKLYTEACNLLNDQKQPITNQILNQAQYTRAIIKETFRMNPISVGIGRILAKDAILSGYFVPEGTVVVTQNQVSCRLEKYFPEPDKFLPERWIKDSQHYCNCSPYLVLPFGHGPRTCIARRLAEQNLQTLILRIIQSYKVEWLGGKLDVLSRPVNKPDQPLLFKFTPR